MTIKELIETLSTCGLSMDANGGAIIRAKRKEANLTQRNVAEEIGYPENYISRYETGAVKISFELFIELLEIIEGCHNE